MAFLVIVKSRQTAGAALMRLNFCVWTSGRIKTAAEGTPSVLAASYATSFLIAGRSMIRQHHIGKSCTHLLSAPAQGLFNERTLGSSNNGIFHFGWCRCDFVVRE